MENTVTGTESQKEKSSWEIMSNGKKRYPGQKVE
jgi:hypothetical protein